MDTHVFGSHMNKVLYIAPFGTKVDGSGRSFNFDRTYIAIKNGFDGAAPNVSFDRMSDMHILDPLSALNNADVIVCDITTHNPNCLYELGFAHGRSKPTILITARSGPIPLDLNHMPVIAYDPDVISDEFINSLNASIEKAIDDPSNFVRTDSSSEVRGNKVFVSYSHEDAEYLERLLVHLRPLEVAGLIDPWVDTQLKAGDRWKMEIETALEAASVAILLVSADFLASDFVVKNELPPILAQAEKGGTRIIPLIIKPCRFARDTNLSCFQSHNSPNKPLSSLVDFERENCFDSLAAILEDSIHIT